MKKGYGARSGQGYGRAVEIETAGRIDFPPYMRMLTGDSNNFHGVVVVPREDDTIYEVIIWANEGTTSNERPSKPQYRGGMPICSNRAISPSASKTPKQAATPMAMQRAALSFRCRNVSHDMSRTSGVPSKRDNHQGGG